MEPIYSNIEVSVLMPVYNRERLVEASISSILNQTYSNFELLILDDGSTDSTIEKILTYKDHRIRLIKNKKNMGIAFSRNRLFQEALGKYFVLLDSDDIALPNRIENQLQYLKKNKETLLVGTPCIGIDINGKVIKATWSFLQKRPTDAQEICATLLFRNCFFQSSIMINRKLLGHQEYNLDFPPFEDYEFWARLSKKHKLENIDKPLIKYRFHSQNISHTTGENYKFELNNKIVSNGFNYYFNYLPSTRELYLHGVWQFYTYKESIDDLKDSSKWLRKIRRMNFNSKVFNEEKFLEVLKRNWFDRCWHHLNKGNVFAAFYFLKYNVNFNLNDIKLFIYLVFKGIYMSVIVPLRKLKSS